MARQLIVVLGDKEIFSGWIEDDFTWGFNDGKAALDAVVTDAPAGTEEPPASGTNQDLVDATTPDQTVPEVEVPNPDVDNGLVEVTPEPTPEPTPITPEVDQGTNQELVDATTPDQTVPTLPQTPDQAVPSVPSGTDNELVEATPPPPEGNPDLTPEVGLGTDQTVPTLPVQKPDQNVPTENSGTDQELVDATPPAPEGNPDLTPEVDQGTDQELVEATPPVEEVPNPDVDNGLVEVPNPDVDNGLVEVPNPDVDNGLVEVPNPDVDNGLVEEVPTPAAEDPWLYAVEQVNQPNRVVDFTAKKGLVLTEEQAIDEGFMFRCAQISSLDGYVRREFSKTFPTYAGPLDCTLEDLYGDGIPANNETMQKTISFVVSPQSVVADAASAPTSTRKKK